MPAFGKDGIVNLNETKETETWQLIKPDGTVVMSCTNKVQLESHQKNLSQKLGVELKLEKKTLRCL